MHPQCKGIKHSVDNVATAISTVIMHQLKHSDRLPLSIVHTQVINTTNSIYEK